MQRRMLTVLLAIVALVACTAMLATDNLGVASKRNITFSEPTLVGGTLLPAGDYTVTHQMTGQTHVMIFKGTKGEAKANCNLVPLKNKAERSEQRYIVNSKNERVLQEMTFAGDKATHMLVQ